MRVRCGPNLSTRVGSAAENEYGAQGREENGIATDGRVGTQHPRIVSMVMHKIQLASPARENERERGRGQSRPPLSPWTPYWMQNRDPVRSPRRRQHGRVLDREQVGMRQWCWPATSKCPESSQAHHGCGRWVWGSMGRTRRDEAAQRRGQETRP